MSSHDALAVAAGHAASATMGGQAADAMHARGVYLVECRAADGTLRWTDEIPNLVTTQGRNHILDTELAGSAYTAAWFLSLYTAGTITAGATYAAPVVTEVVVGVLAARPSVGWTAAAAGSKASTTTTCPIVGSATITGVMLVRGSGTTGDTAAAGGVLLSAGLLGTSRAVLNGDQLNISYSLAV